MKITQDFKNAIKNTFYDKTVEVLDVEVMTDVEGGTYLLNNGTTDTFLANVRIENLEKVQEDFGIMDKIDIALTTDEVVEAGVVVQYDGRVFKLIKAFTFDSHYLLVGQLWSSELQTLTSA